MPDQEVCLQPKQLELLDLLEATGPDVPRRIGWGGARGAAKSGGLRRVAMVLASQYPGIVIVIVRKHLGDLLENHVEKMRLEYPEFHEKYYKLSEYEWRLDNKSRIILAYGDTPKDIQEFSRGPEYTFAFVDQAEQFTEQELTWLMIPNRWPSAKQGFAKTAFFFNPGGPGTEFLRRVFHLKEFKAHEVPHEWYFVQAYGWSNYVWFQGELPLTSQQFYAIPGECVNFPEFAPSGLNCCRFHLFISSTSEGRKMMALPPSLRVGELLGSFESFSGQYFAGVWDEGQCVISSTDARLMIQPWWKCLVAGTSVKTDRGDIPIEKVRAGDLVWTRKGLRRVLRSWKSGVNREVVRAVFSNGKSLIATPDHEIFTTNCGFKRLDSLSMGDRLVTWNLDTSTAKSTPRKRSDTIGRSQRPFIGTYGNTITDLFRKAFTSITRMEIAQITISQILNAFRSRTISALAEKAESELQSIARKCLRALRHGVQQRKASHTTPYCEPRELSLAASGGMSFAVGAASSPKLSLPERHFAPQPATKDGDGWKAWTTSNENAKYADLRTDQTRPIRSKPAQEVADKNSVYIESLQHWGSADVYDLAVEGDHEFFANDILVHNCWAAIDWGFAHHAVVVWCAAGKLSPLQFQAFFGGTVEWPVDIIIAYRELVTNETEETDLALRIVEMTPKDERAHLRHIYLSPDAFAKKGSASTVADQLSSVFTRAKLPKTDRAMNDRVPGWRMMYNLLRQTRGMRAENPDPSRAKAGPMFVVGAECPELIQAIPLAVRDEKNIEDVLKTPTVADDCLDALRYSLASHLQPKETAPLEVRAAEAVTGIQDNTARAMILGKFHSKNGTPRPIARRKRFR